MYVRVSLCVFLFLFFFFSNSYARVSVWVFVSGNGSVVRYEVSSAQFGCGREHNKTD